MFWQAAPQTSDLLAAWAELTKDKPMQRAFGDNPLQDLTKALSIIGDQRWSHAVTHKLRDAFNCDAANDYVLAHNSLRELACAALERSPTCIRHDLVESMSGLGNMHKETANIGMNTIGLDKHTLIHASGRPALELWLSPLLLAYSKNGAHTGWAWNARHGSGCQEARLGAAETTQMAASP